MEHVHGTTSSPSTGTNTTSSVHTMSMSFHGGINEVILWNAWTTTTTGEYVVTWFAMFFFAVVFEWLTTFNQKFVNRHPSKASNNSIRLIQTLLHMARLTLGYVLMLVVMTFNTGLFFAIVGGAGLGYFLFSPQRMIGQENVRQLNCCTD
eukprot:Colp12_sorted_trinity150504_noHs@34956